jgi:hypothetical protein
MVLHAANYNNKKSYDIAGRLLQMTVGPARLDSPSDYPNGAEYVAMVRGQ